MHTRTPRSENSREPVEQELLAKALATAADPIFITDHTGRIVWVNEAFSERSGYSPQEAVGQTPSFLKSGSHDASFYRELWQTILAGRVWRGEVVERRKDGNLYTADEVITPLRDDMGTVTHFVAIQHDITLRKQEAQREHFLAYHDALTGLYNRVLFLDLLQQAIARSKHSLDPLALLFLDMDNFKLINDTFGHETGDRLLIAVAERLGAAVRKTTDAVARLSGDEFAILQTGLNDPQAALSLARKLLHSISQPFLLEGRKVQTSVSIGIAIYPTDGEGPDDLLRNADKAMYLAKSRGRGNYQLYDPTLCHS
ncbi:MAG: diguanylate cyclase [Betaproteobacteria bacterium]|nr:diguanylate cyclase [Betaproteobacteria bacterium]